jgi:hypothetical protein
LEYDLNGQGSSLAEALRSLARVFEDTVALDEHFGKEPLSSVGPAPQEFVERFEHSYAMRELPLSEMARQLNKHTEARIFA